MPDLAYSDWSLGGCWRGSRAQRRTNAWELDATVTAFWWASLLLSVLVLELATGGLDDSDFVGARIVTIRI